MRSLYALLLLLAMPAAAQPYVYWANYGSAAIGRAGLDGTGSNASFISGAGMPVGVAADGNYVYWTGANTISRAHLDGSNVNASFVGGTGFGYAVAVSNSHIYWASGNNIGRADLDGSNANTSFITGLNSATGVAINGTHIYWADNNGNTIGRANLDGTAVMLNLITTPVSPYHVAVDGNYVYWTNYSTNTSIGRANLDGTGANQSFIALSNYCAGVDTDDNYVYWSCSNGKIGRANLDGTGANLDFITGAGGPWGIAVPISSTLPVELVSFTATLDGTSGLLRWATASETNNAGFSIEHRSGAGSYQSVGFQAGQGTTAEASRYSFATEALAPGTHTFRLKQTDFDGAFSYSPEVELTVSPAGLMLMARAEAGRITGTVAAPQGKPVTVALFDALGRRVAAQQIETGAFTLGGDLASGVYVVRVTGGSQTLTRSVVVAR